MKATYQIDSGCHYHTVAILGEKLTGIAIEAPLKCQKM
jgi:hypothetical protein